MVEHLGDLKRDLVADDLFGDPAADRVGAPELAVGVVDERIIGEGRDDRVLVVRIDGRDVLSDDSVKLAVVVLMRASLVPCLCRQGGEDIKVAASSDRRVKDQLSP